MYVSLSLFYAQKSLTHNIGSASTLPIIKEISRQQGRLNKARTFASERYCSFPRKSFQLWSLSFQAKEHHKTRFWCWKGYKIFFDCVLWPEAWFHISTTPKLGWPQPTSFTTSTGPPSIVYFSAILRSRRKSFAPGPNSIANMIWKRCPSLRKRLYSVISRVWNT